MRHVVQMALCYKPECCPLHAVDLLHLQGQFLYRDDSGATPFQPAPMPDDVPLQHITLYISDYVPNSFFFAMHRHGVFNKTHDTKSVRCLSSPNASLCHT